MTWILLAATAAGSCQCQQRTAPLQPQGQLGGDKRVPPLDGGVRRRLVVAVGEVLHPVEVGEALEEALGGVGVQVLGHPPQRGDGGPTHQLVRGVQEAAAGEPAAQLETPLAGAAQIRRRKAVGTCDAYP